MTAEVALAVVLVSSTALLALQFIALIRSDMGFAPDHVLTLEVPRAKRPGPARMHGSSSTAC